MKKVKQELAYSETESKGDMTCQAICLFIDSIPKTDQVVIKGKGNLVC